MLNVSCWKASFVRLTGPYWTYNQGPQRREPPTFGAFFLGLEVGRTNSFPHSAALDLLDRASKKGKGQLPVLIGALFRGKELHLSLHAGGNDMAQLKLPGCGVVNTSEKHTLAHSKQTGICADLGQASCRHGIRL